MTTYNSFSAHQFSSMEDLPFLASDYSHLKFGSNRVAQNFGYQLAERFFDQHSSVLLANQCVVIPSPYNFVPNAATIMAQHFTDKLNQLLVNANGNHVEWSIIHRKVTYTNDYGFLPREQRKNLLQNDKFYLNRGFIKNKVLLFIDDVKITGTHEDKLIEILKKERLRNDAMFLYYADYVHRDVNADIEAKLNFAGIQTLEDYFHLTQEDNHHLIVRPIKFLLSQPRTKLAEVVDKLKHSFVRQLYNACLGEGYYKIPSYQDNFQVIANRAIAIGNQP